MSYEPYEPEFVRERQICRVLGARGAKDALDGMPEDPDPLSDDGTPWGCVTVDLTSFYLSEPEYLAELFLAAYRAGYGAIAPGRGTS